MTEFLTSLGAWSWFVLGVLLMGLEIAAPGAFMLWFGLAAVAVGALTLLVDWDWQAQLVTFAVLALVAALVGRALQKRYGTVADVPFLNRRGEGHVGRRLTLAEPIRQNQGRVVINDTVWRVRGPDAEAGEDVIVVGSEGAVLVVRPVRDDGLPEAAVPPT